MLRFGARPSPTSTFYVCDFSDGTIVRILILHKCCRTTGTKQSDQGENKLILQQQILRLTHNELGIIKNPRFLSLSQRNVLPGISLCYRLSLAGYVMEHEGTQASNTLSTCDFTILNVFTKAFMRLSHNFFSLH